MANFKGTKGKWELNENEYGYYTSVFTNNSQNPNPFRTICVSRVNNQIQNNANLKLISKAPEMFEILEYFIENNMLSIAGEEMAKKLIKEATEL